MNWHWHGSRMKVWTKKPKEHREQEEATILPQRPQSSDSAKAMKISISSMLTS